MSRIARIAFCCSFTALMIGVLSAQCSAADPPNDSSKAANTGAPPKVIKPAETKDHQGELVIVEFTVVGGKEIDSGVCFLNSSKDRDDPDRFTAFITKKGLTALKEDAKIAKPADHFKNKKVQVTGKIKEYNQSYEIEITSPDQIKIVEDDVENAAK